MLTSGTELGCVKNGQFVCLDNNSPLHLPQFPVSCPSGHSGVKGEGIDVENHPLCFCFSVLLSYSYSHCFFSLSASILLSLSFIIPPLDLSVHLLSAFLLLLFFFLLSLLLPVDSLFFLAPFLHDHPWALSCIWMSACPCACRHICASVWLLS